MRDQGIEVLGRESHEAGAHPLNAGYLATKRDRLGHLLDAGLAPHGPG